MYKAVDMNLRVRLSYRDENDTYLGDENYGSLLRNSLKMQLLQVS